MVSRTLSKATVKSDNTYTVKFFVTPLIFLLLNGVEGWLLDLYSQSLQGFPTKGLLVGMHSHIALLGAFPIFMFGVIYLLVLPKYDKAVRSIKVANIGFWLTAVFVFFEHLVGLILGLYFPTNPVWVSSL